MGASALRLPGWARTPIQWKKAFWKHLSVRIHFVKSQRIYLDSWLVLALIVWTSPKMHESLLCLKFEAVVDVTWKSFLVCLINWMLNFFQIKYFDVDTHGAFDYGSIYFSSECQGLYFLIPVMEILTVFSWNFETLIISSKTKRGGVFAIYFSFRCHFFCTIFLLWIKNKLKIGMKLVQTYV